MRSTQTEQETNLDDITTDSDMDFSICLMVVINCQSSEYSQIKRISIIYIHIYTQYLNIQIPVFVPSFENYMAQIMFVAPISDNILI